MSQSTNWEADRMLDVYIYDYLMKRKLHATAKAFQAEGKVSTDPVAIDAPGGFLFEWWSVFWDIFIARTNEKHSEAAASYIETQMVKACEMQQQQQNPKPHHHQQMQMQQLLLQRHAQQQQQQHQQKQQNQQQQQQQHQLQRRDGNQHVNGMVNGFIANDVTRQTSATASALATKMYEDGLKLPLQDDAAMKQRLNDNVGQLVDPNHGSLLKAAALGGQPPGQMLPNTQGGSGNHQHVQNRNQQLSVSAQDIRNEMSSMISPRNAVTEGSMIGMHGSNQGGNNLPLKGWPLTGLDQLGLQNQRMMQSHHPLNKFQLQQQLILQAQQNLGSPSVSDLERRKLRMLLNNQNIGLGKDGPLNSGHVISNIGTTMQVGCPLSSRGEQDMQIKLQQQNNNQQQKQPVQHALPSQQSQSQNSNHHLQQQDKAIGSGSITVDGTISNNFQGNDQSSKHQIGRKRKQPVSSSGPANSSGTANTTGPSPSSPSTPSTHTPGDAISMPNLSQNVGSSKSLLMYSSDGLGSLASAPNELADIEHFVDDRTLDDNVDSFFSQEATDPTDRRGRSVDVTKGFTFSHIRHIPASNNKIECCHFSSDGKLLATGGHDKKVTLWCTESFTVKSSLEEHSQWITDVRFSPGMSRLATSSADTTVRVWDADNPGYTLRTFTGHSSTVMSVDFHPCKEDLIFSTDNSEMRYWSIKNGSCAGVTKGGATQIRFQPRMGRILAAAVENLVSIVDVDTQVCRVKLQGHKTNVHSVCWDPSGEYLASTSDDLVRVWKVGSGGKAEFIYELNCTGNKFHSCVFHPTHPSLLVIGCYETLELWNMTQNKTMTLPAHEKLVSALAVSDVAGLVASGSHDKCIKIWN